MVKLLLAPPIAFIVIFITVLVISRLCSRLSFKPKTHTFGETESYACGEKNYDNSAQPDYSLFFPFAFFFTLAHVATLIMSTAPKETIQTFIMGAIYIVGASLGLYILFRK
jgi:NADH:ubiquinone oxidoreductase subunit 3 (subunit A)